MSAPNAYTVNAPVLDNSATPTLAHDQESLDARAHRDSNEEKKRRTDDDGSLEDGIGKDSIIEEKSKGVQEMESLKERLNVKLLVVIYGCFTILAYCLSVNQYTAGVFLNYATSESFGKHSLQATITTVTAVFQAMAQPPVAKCADYFGRTKTYFGLVFFYVLGYIIVASSNSIVTYAVGNSIYVIGITGLFLIQNVVISDLSSSRNRWWWTTFPNILACINGFISGDITSSLLGQENGVATKPNNWRWGFGMFCILIPVLTLPIMTVMWWGTRPNRVLRAEIKAAQAARRQEPFSARAKRELKRTFWQLDLIGLVLFIIGFGLFFVTITTANSRTARWSDAHSIAQLVLGAVVIAAFVVWERSYAPHPLLPFALLRRKTVVGCTLIALLSPMGGRITANYLLTFLQVAAGQSIKSATNITAYPSVAGVITGIVASLAARKLRTLKWFIVLGFCLQVLGTGLMLRYRTSTNSQAELAIVQVIRGIASGLLPFPTQALIQIASPHEHLAAITAGWLVVYYMAGGIGSAIGGAIWTTVVPRKLEEYVTPLGNSSLVPLAFSNPLGYAVEYPLGTPERNAIARAQDDAQRIMVITGLCVAIAALLVSIFLLDNIRLTDEQSLPESEDLGEKTQDGTTKKNKWQWNPFATHTRSQPADI